MGNSGHNYDNSISGSIRKRASGGAGGYVGEFKNKTLGLYMMYATEKKDLVLVRCTDGIFVLASIRIVELGFFGIYDDVILRKLAEVDLRPVDLQLCNVGLRRDVALDYVRLTG